MTSFRVACRSLARRPGFTFIAILTLAVGIAATTTVFSVVDTVLLKGLPFPDPDRLVTVMEANPARSQSVSGRAHTHGCGRHADRLRAGSRCPAGEARRHHRSNRDLESGIVAFQFSRTRRNRGERKERSDLSISSAISAIFAVSSGRHVS